MEYEWIDKSHLEHNQIKESKKVKIIVKNAACKQKLARKRTFFQTPFSHCTLKLERKNFMPQNQALFRFTTYFGGIKNNFTKNALHLTRKIMKMNEQNLEKT